MAGQKHTGMTPFCHSPALDRGIHFLSYFWIPAYETVSQFEKRENMLVFRNGFTPNFLKKPIVGNSNRPLFSIK
jgi:hypothetical protein